MCTFRVFSRLGIFSILVFLNVGELLSFKSVVGESNFSEKVVTDSRSALKSGLPSPANLGWISHVLSEKLSNFRPRSRTNSLCNQQSDLYEQSLQNLTLWAVQMKEASAASTAGMLMGQRFQLGHYDECIAIQTPSVAGRYCLVYIKFAPTVDSYPDFHTSELEGIEAHPYSNAWDQFKKSKNRFRYFRNEIFRGVCVPAACSQQDVEESLNETFSDVQHKYGIDLSMPTYEHMCSSNVEDNPLPTASKATMYVLVFLTIFTVLMTLLHLSLGGSDVIPNETGSFGQKIMMSFSMTNNFERLLRGTKGKNMNILDGLKFYSAVQVLVKHRIAFMFLSMIFNPSFYESEIKNDQLLFMPTLVVETFFIISGFLLFVITYTPLEKYGIKIIPLMILDRWLRLMPSLLVLTIFTIFLYPHVDNGPIWKFLTNSTAESCRKDGWLNLLGVNNLYYNDKEVPCLGHLWYLACDLQLFLVGIFLVYMFSRSHSLGIKFALGAFALSVAIPFSIIYINKYDGVPKVDPRVYPEGVNVNYFFNIYIQSYTRAGPYILSIIAGFLLLKIERNQWTLSVPLRWFIIIMSIIVGQGSQYYGLVLYNPNREYGPLENALFGALHRSLWSLMICAIIVIQIAWGLGGKVDEILTHPIYVPLSRLAYLVYLFHPVWQFMTAASTRTPTYLSVWSIIWMTGGDILVVYTSALWLYFIFEAPVNKMRSSLMSKFVRIIEEPVKSGKLVSEKMD